MRAPTPSFVHAGPSPWARVRAACARVVRRRAPLLGVLATSALFGCGIAPVSPVIEAVSPPWGYNGEGTEISILGANFFPTVVLGEDDEALARTEGTFRAWVTHDGETFALDAVQRRAQDELAAEVPAGLEPGLYDLRVEVPSGLDSTLAGAFLVTDTRADHLELYISDASYAVGSFAAVTVTLQDPTDRVVTLPMEIEVRAVPASDASDVSGVRFYESGLGDQGPLESGVGVRGWLDEDGAGVVLLTSEIEADVRLEVGPVGDSIVRGDEQVLSWEPGPVNRVELILPRSPFRTVAGNSFDLGIRLLDAYDNVLDAEPAALLLWDACGNELTPFVEIVGEGTVPLTLTTSCSDNRISAFAFETVWTTDAFEVLPGPVEAYRVQAAPATVVAGSDVLVFVEAIDGYGNLVADHEAALELRDDVGGLDPDLGIGEQSCPGFSNGVQVCTGTPWSARDAVVIRAEDASGRSGAASPLEVLAADPVSVGVDLSEVSVQAGERFDVVVRVNDLFGNAVAFDPAGTDPVVFTDASGTIGCSWTGAADPGQGFSCAIEGAVADADVTARVIGLTGRSPDPLEVVNGPLALVEVDPLTTTFEAGTLVTVELRGYDAYGNAYVEQSDPVLDLEDTGGSMSPVTARLGASGAVQISATLYAAGTGRIYAAQAGTRLGASPTLSVAAAGIDGLEVDVAPWVSVDDPADVTLTAVDPYGNAVSNYAGVVNLSPRGAGCAQATVTDFRDGVAQVALSCATPTLSESLLAEDADGYAGESDVFDVVDLACASGPTAAFTVEGDDYARVCLTAGGEVDVTAETSGSTRGGASIAVRHFSDGETRERTLATATTFTYALPGTRRIEALVVDSAACADLAEGYAYVGYDDGEPTGPVDISLSAGSATSSGSVTVTLAATDCTGDVAAGESLLVRADLGSPAGAATGEGLAITLDATGGKSVTWGFSSGHAGVATVYAGSASGGAFGSAELTVSGDSALPEIVSMDPSGATSGLVTTVSVLFNEPMLARNMSAGQIAFNGPSGTVSATYALDVTLTTLTITPAAAIDADAGAYHLIFSTGVRDVAGNQLDGAWTGVAAGHSVYFGSVGDALPTVTSCAVDTEVFTPDGDDGAGAEADTVGITPVSTAAPSWWWLLVTDADGARVRSARQPGTDATISWDGRGDDGFVAAPGTHTLSLHTIDTYGNVGEACDVTVDLEQHVAAP